MTEQMTTEPSNNGLPRGNVKRWAPLAGIIFLMAIGFSQGWHTYFSLEALIEHRERLVTLVSENYLLTLGGYSLFYILAVALSFPGASFLTIAGGFLFGWAIGGGLTVLAASIGASLIFLAARSAFGASLRARAGGFIDRFQKGFSENAFSYLLFLRLVPLFPFWLINVVPALFNIRLGTYFLATLIGILPGTFAYAFIGAGLDSVIQAQRAANPACSSDPECAVTFDASQLVTTELVIALVAMGVVSLIPPALKALKKGRKRDEIA